MKKMGEIINNTLVELIINSIAELKLQGKKSGRRKRQNDAQKGKGSINSSNPVSIGIANIIANSKPVKNKKSKEDKKELKLEETAEEAEAGKEKESLGGYGTIKAYSGMSPYVKYANYDKIWSHIGTFRTYNMFGDSDSMAITAMKNGESSREMVSQRTQEMAARNFKYFMRSHANTVLDAFTVTSLVPPVGSNINSKDWEKYTIMMKMSIYQPILALMYKFA
ncbi:MAG: hypothetical protein AABX34_02405 [Nanoarchaeota archaeon]